MIARAIFCVALFLASTLNAAAAPVEAAASAGTAAVATFAPEEIAPATKKKFAREEAQEIDFEKCLAFESMQVQFRAPAQAAQSCPCKEQDTTRALNWKVNAKNSCGKIVDITAQLTAIGPDGFIAEESFAESYESISVNQGDDAIVGKFILNSQDGGLDFTKAFSRVRVTLKSQPRHGQEQILRIFDIPAKNIAVVR